jgi:hypothetical protein
VAFDETAVWYAVGIKKDKIICFANQDSFIHYPAFSEPGIFMPAMKNPAFQFCGTIINDFSYFRT